jgi:hypothetical protein
MVKASLGALKLSLAQPDDLDALGLGEAGDRAAEGGGGWVRCCGKAIDRSRTSVFSVRCYNLL